MRDGLGKGKLEAGSWERGAWGWIAGLRSRQMMVGFAAKLLRRWHIRARLRAHPLKQHLSLSDGQRRCGMLCRPT